MAKKTAEKVLNIDRHIIKKMYMGQKNFIFEKLTSNKICIEY